MTQYISIEWISGRPIHGAAEDEQRARAAAEAVLDAFVWGRGSAPQHIDYVEAGRAYDHLMDIGASYRTHCTPHSAMLTAAWVAAEGAANRALTAGWAKPGGASCVIQAWEH